MYRHIVLLLSVLFAAACPLQTVFASAGSEEEEYDPVLPPDPSSSYVLTLQAEPAEAATSLIGAGAYQSGAVVSISAAVVDDYVFVRWLCDGEEVSTTANATFTMPARHATLVAQCAPKPLYTLSLSASPAEGATTHGAGTYYAGKTIRVGASPAEDYIFLRWEQNGTTLSTDTAFSFTMPESDAALQAVCRYAPMRLVTASPDDAAAGTVSLSPKPASTTNGRALYEVGSTVQLSAVAKTNFLFSHWTLNGAVFTSEPAFSYTVGMQDAVFVAVFDYDPQQPADPALNIRNKVLLACDPVGAATFNYATLTEHAEGSVLSLRAATKSGYRPDGWYIEDTKLPNQTVSGQDVTVEYTVTDAPSVTLTYRATEIIRSQLNLTASPQGSITFNTSSGNIYEAGTVLTLRAVVADGYLFTGWYQGDSLLAKTTSLTYTVGSQATTLIAKADKVPTEEGGEEEEEWDPLPPADPALETVYIIAQSEDNSKGRAYGSASYVVGKTATIRAVANTGYTFSRWSDGNTDSVRTLTVSTAATYTAYFSPKYYQVTVLSANPQYGSVTGSGAYAYHSSATLTATPAAGCSFLRWSDDSAEPVHTIYVASDTTLTAYFASPTCHLDLSASPADAGTVEGVGDYEKGSVVQISAQPAADYSFLKWSDGVTDNPRSVTLTRDTAFEAEFIHQASLLSIAYDGVAVPDFDPSVLEYTVTLPSAQTALPIISATAYDANARLVFIQATTLPGQASVVVITSSGALQTYTVKFVRSLSSDATLQSLTYNNGVPVQDFKSSRLVYEVTLSSQTTSAPTLTAVASDPNARVIIIQASSFPGQASVVVISSDGTATLTYTVSFRAGQSSDAALSELTYDGIAIPNFSADELSYMVSLDAGSALPWVAATPRDAFAVVDVEQVMSLPAEAKVTVTAEDGTIRTYTIYFAVRSVSTDNSEPNAAETSMQVHKVMVDGKVYILVSGVRYGVEGRMLDAD